MEIETFLTFTLHSGPAKILRLRFPGPSQMEIHDGPLLYLCGKYLMEIHFALLLHILEEKKSLRTLSSFNM